MIDAQTIDQNRKKAFWLTILTIFFVLCTLFAVQQMEIDLRTALQKTDPAYLILSAVFMSLAFYCMGLRWRALMPIRPPSLELSGLICAGLLLNYAVPGPVGELSTAWFASKRYPISTSEALASGVVARLIGLITAALVGGIIWVCFDLPIDPDPNIRLAIQSTAVFTLSMGLGLLSILLFPQFWLYLAQKLDHDDEKSNFLIKIQQKGFKAVASLCRSISSLSYQKDSSYLEALLWSFGAHTCVVLGILSLAISLQTDYSVVGIIFTYCVTTAGAVLLFALPGSYLGWDALFLG
ncbi:MAG: lysylphosphatidylglycerol synthase transmembrane domain-containing protein, partial [Myxococcota bacterium]|nr:lysylphosphatidylglycerol synthase transmembrane domain-containing protein [Myxococcota bacterium]